MDNDTDLAAHKIEPIWLILTHNRYQHQKVNTIGFGWEIVDVT